MPVLQPHLNHSIEFVISWIGKVSLNLQKKGGFQGSNSFHIARVAADHLVAAGNDLRKYPPVDTADMLIADMVTYAERHPEAMEL